MRRVVVLAFLAACGSSHDKPSDGSIIPPEDGGISDGTPDAGPDAPPDVSPVITTLLVNDGAGTVTSATLPATFAAQTSSVRLFVYNTDASASAAIVPTLTGSDAASFSIDTAHTTCGGPLAAHELCTVEVAFAPTTAGGKTATLVVPGGGDPLPIALTGASLPPPASGLTTDVATLDFGTITRTETRVLNIVVHNVDAAPVTLGTRTVSAPFYYYSDDCPTTIAPDATCTIGVSFTAAAAGHFTGTLAIPSSANSLAIPLDVTALRLITAGGQGDGAGAITSTPAGISCPGACSAGFPVGIPVDLVATTDVANVFQYWTGLCSGPGTCTVPSPTDGDVGAEFALVADPKLTITMAGTALSFVGVEAIGHYTTCWSSCELYFPPGTQVSLTGRSPSTFVGWSGDCTGSDPHCDLGAITADRAVTLTSAPDPYEVASLYPDVTTQGLAISSSGDLLVGTSTGVTRMTITGTVVWTTPIAGGVQGVAVDAADEVFAIGTDALIKLSPTGGVSWSVSIAPKVPNQVHDPSVAVSPDGTVVAVNTTTGVRVLDGAGADRFTVPDVVYSVGVATDGTVALSEQWGDNSQAVRYAADGTLLAPFLGLGEPFAVLAYGSLETLCSFTAAETFSTISCRTSTGAIVFSTREMIINGSPKPSGVVVTPGGEVMKEIDVGSTSSSPRTKVDIYASDGTPIYSTYKEASGSGYYDMGVHFRWIASGGTNRIAIAGEFYFHPWIQIIDLP